MSLSRSITRVTSAITSYNLWQASLFNFTDCLQEINNGLVTYFMFVPYGLYILCPLDMTGIQLLVRCSAVISDCPRKLACFARCSQGQKNVTSSFDNKRQTKDVLSPFSKKFDIFSSVLLRFGTNVVEG